MVDTNKVIITCAVTGSIHTPTMSPHLPITPDEIADDLLVPGKLALQLYIFTQETQRMVVLLRSRCIYGISSPSETGTDAVVNISTGGGHGMTVQQRLEAAVKASPKMTSLNMGSMNFGFFPILDKMSVFPKHVWGNQNI
ncbi:MAG: hypothetical protein CM15mP62_26610 [Rhodospirillaceae bacterium]|nr:MAG: hypothetical protein CM15mP62_26610 [Rhodospirillaceae bacterium]